MKIGVDACCWSNKRGFGRFTRELLTAMVATETPHTFVFFADQATAAVSTFPEGVEVVAASTKEMPTEAAAAAGRRSLGDMMALTRQVRKHDLDLFFFPAVYSYFPILNRTQVVVTIHDVIADNDPKSTFPNRRAQFFWQAKERLALFQSDRVLTVSKHSKRTICSYFGLPETAVAVTTEGASATFRNLPHDAAMHQVLRPYGLEPTGRFVLYVGGISPHKNLQTLVDAFAALIQDPATADVKLVLVGDYERDGFYTDYPRLKQQVEHLGLEEQVVFTGYVPDDELVYLYNAAHLLAFPSLDEGFGLPAVEAMQCGTPVAASNRGSLPEIVGGAGRLYDPLDPIAIRQVLHEILQNDTLRASLQQQSLARAQQFTWHQAAEQTLRLFEQMQEVRA